MARSPSHTLVIIPARMASERLPGKPLADIAGRPMILHVADRAHAANIGRVVVATDSPEISACVENAGFSSLITRNDHASGSDRAAEALERLDPDGKVETILNVQGDIPTIEPETIRRSIEPLQDETVDIATVAVEIREEEEKDNPNIVKVVGTPLKDRRLRALYFTRARAPHGAGPFYHHIGLYAYRRIALKRFVSLPPGNLERRESLEQLRALENGMRIDVAIVDSAPLGVDTRQDLEKARHILSKAGH